MKFVHWYKLISENIPNKKFNKLIKKEFSPKINIAKKRIKELKKILVGLDSWMKIDILKEMIYCYINNQLISSIALGGMLIEIILEELLNEFDELIKNMELKSRDIVYGLFKHSRNKLRYVGQKIEFFKELPLHKDFLKLINDIEEISKIRNKYIHIKFLKNENYKKEVEKDSKKAISLLIKILNELRPTTSDMVLGYIKSNPNKVLIL